MQKRFAHIWFKHLLTDWLIIRRPRLKDKPFVFVANEHGRIMITAINAIAQQQGIKVGMRAADAKAICPELETIDNKDDRCLKLLKGLGEWCIRFSPIVMIDEFSKDGLFMDISGCTHLWGGENQYLNELVGRLKSKGYTTQIAIADSLGTAWAASRFRTLNSCVTIGQDIDELMSLPPEALRLPEVTLSKLKKLGFYQIRALLSIPRSVLRRRFGEDFLMRLEQALGKRIEVIKPLKEPFQFQERLACLEPVKTREGIEIALERLLGQLCLSLQKEEKGIRAVILTGYRVDNKLVQIHTGTNVASNDLEHLFKLFQLKIEKIRPGLGIELFTLEAVKVNNVKPEQEAFWLENKGISSQGVVQLLDRIAGKVGEGAIRRYLPAEHFWPERSLKNSLTIGERPSTDWRLDHPRPTELLKKPEPVDVMSVIPDSPPKFFIYKGAKHTIVKADGPERIEKEWWLDNEKHRDYYQVEDERGQRYWLFRSGYYDNTEGVQWFIHGFFA